MADQVPGPSSGENKKFQALVEVASVMHEVETVERAKRGMPDHLRETFKDVPNRPYPARKGEDPNMPKIGKDEGMCKEYCNHCRDRIHGPKVQVSVMEKKKRRQNIGDLVVTAFQKRVKRIYAKSIHDEPSSKNHCNLLMYSL